MSKKGYSLIELLIIIAIIGIMTGVGLVSLSSAKRHYALKTAKEEVTAGIKLAQSYALQGKMPNATVIACAYGFEFLDNSANSGYRIFYYQKDTAGDCDKTVKTTLESNNLKNGVRITTLIADSTITFDIPNADIDPSAGIVIGLNTSSGSPESITISSSGLVSEN